MTANDFALFTAQENCSLLQAMDLINRNSSGILFICEGDVVKAALTDGDIRRHLLAGGSLSDPVKEIANYQFISIQEQEIPLADEMMKQHAIRSLPVLDTQGRLIRILHHGEKPVLPKPVLGIPVVIMAGGKGTRLKPFTNVLPKPLIPIGDCTITEHIMNRFMEYGCDQFTLVVNYKKNVIKAYFSDIESPCQIQFAQEDVPLGTGGGLKLLENKISGTFFLTNCDILVNADYSDLLNHHRSSGAIATLVCVEKELEVPYGVVNEENGLVVSMTEKPSYHFLTNSGVYVMESTIFRYIPDHTFIHITDVLQACMDAGEKVGVYTISAEQWADMGQLDEMEKMLKSMGADE